MRLLITIQWIEWIGDKMHIHSRLEWVEA